MMRTLFVTRPLC